MTDFDEMEISTVLPNAARAYRRRIRTGFALCAVALGTVLAYAVASVMGIPIGPASGSNMGQDNLAAWKFSGMAVEGVTTGLLIAGFVLLYRVPYGQRWRMASTLLLAMAGADVAFLSLRVAGGDAKVLALSALFGFALRWIELWMLAVLAAEAAEAAVRPDLTYQTEVVGKLVVWGAFAWLVAMVWSFDPDQLGDASQQPQDLFMVVADYAAVILRVIVLARTTLCCAGLVNAYAPARNDAPPH